MRCSSKDSSKASLVKQLLVVKGRHARRAVELGQAQADARAVNEQIRAVDPRLAAKIGETDNGKLKTFGSVNGHQAHGVLSVADRRLRLGSIEHVELVIDVLKEAAQITAFVRFKAMSKRKSLWTLARRREPQGSASRCC